MQYLSALCSSTLADGSGTDPAQRKMIDHRNKLASQSTTNSWEEFMKKGFFAFVAFLIVGLAPQLNAADMGNYGLSGSLDFIAPSVGNNGSLPDGEVGLIVYDITNDGFYGR